MEIKIIPTSKELFDKMLSENDETTSTEMMIEFAKMHVEAALKEVTKSLPYDDKINQSLLDTMTILNSYPLDNIK
jgi:UDP-N-acetylglucosamine 2-epimerase